MKLRRIAALMLLTGGAVLAGIVDDVRASISGHNLALAWRQIQQYRAAAGVTPDMLEALSWLARSELDAKQFDRADAHATETRKLSLALLNRTGKGDAPLVTALGAAIEVHAQALAGQGHRAEAVTYLQAELKTWKASAMAARIQKNINLLSLAGKPAPALDLSHFLGAKPPAIESLKGHPVLLFFWAHWCVDCKAEVPILVKILENYGPRGLVVIGPTQLYGYTAAGDATPDAETSYIDQVRKQYYAPLAKMTVPVSADNFERYGASTTPTLVLMDKAGIVRLYHPGAMSYEALAAMVKQISSAPNVHPGLEKPHNSPGNE
jgi:thiol-disulfide isomerase/thioredoxin